MGLHRQHRLRGPFPYKNGDLRRPGRPRSGDLPGGGKLGGGGHWTRDIVFSKDGKRMFVSVGSHSNVNDPDTNPEEFHRADVLEFTPEGKFVKVYASGIRNCVGEAIKPMTGQLWCSTNERDRLGDNLVPDYITHIQEGGFYGWPWYYMGGTRTPATRAASRAEVQGDHAGRSAAAPLRVAGDDLLRRLAVPRSYKGDAFAAEHGSWNKAARAGYEVSLSPCTTATRPANTKTSSPASPQRTAMCGDGQSASRSQTTARCL